MKPKNPEKFKIPFVSDVTRIAESKIWYKNLIARLIRTRREMKWEVSEGEKKTKKNKKNDEIFFDERFPKFIVFLIWYLDEG